jgi:DNA-binding transcriptional MerR regulator
MRRATAIPPTATGGSPPDAVRPPGEEPRAAAAERGGVAAPAAAPAPAPAAADGADLLRIQETSELVGLTPRSIRYYEEMGLLRPSARSNGAYRLYDASDLERLRFIKGLRDDAGFSLAEIGRLLEGESERQRAREAFRATEDPRERRVILTGSIARIDGQIATLQTKVGRLQAMIDDAQLRRARLETLLAGLEDEP